jgi:hypothetical protein
MKEMRFGKIYCSVFLIFECGLLILCCFLTVHYLHSLTIAKDTRTILLGFFMPIFFLLLAKSVFADIVFFVRFYDLRIKLLDDKLILNRDNRECQIPANKDVNVIYCMFGWLIIWTSGDKSNMILLRKNFFLGRTCQELRQYFELNMNYISLKEEKKKILKAFHVNVFNPVKYIKWPA